MKLRDLMKANFPNDGTRSLLESIMIPEVEAAFKDWKKNSSDLKFVLIGGIALSYYVKPRSTTDADLLFLTPEDIPATVNGFKRTRPGAFQHNQTHVEVEVLTPTAINMSQEIAQAIFDNSKSTDGIKVASPAGLIVSKLGRFNLQDKADIGALYELGPVDLSPYPIPKEWEAKYQTLVDSI
jgi:hypothetical protein